jgi:microcompartment protein CcmK/EutM
VRGAKGGSASRPYPTRPKIMQLAKVIGTVVSSRKEESLQGLKLLMVRPVDEDGKETGNPLVAADAVGAGPDEIVLVAAGSSARQTKETDKRPVDAVIMAIVDTWSVEGKTKYRKNEDRKLSED